MEKSKKMEKSKPMEKSKQDYKSTIPLAQCSDVIRRQMLQCIAPSDIKRMSEASTVAAELIVKCEMPLTIDAVFHRGSTKFTFTSPGGFKSDCIIGRDLLEVLKTYKSYTVRNVVIKWSPDSGKAGYRNIFNSFYFLPNSLKRYKMEQGSMRFLCQNLRVKSDATDHEGIEKLQHALHCFKIDRSFELDGVLISFQDLLNTPIFLMHNGEPLKETHFLNLDARVAVIVLKRPEKTWRLNDILFNAFLRSWQEGHKKIKFLEVGSDVRKPGPVDQLKLDILVAGLDAKLTKFGSRKFVVEELNRKISCRGGWDIESSDGEIGTILRTYGKFTFVVWPKEENDLK